MCLHGQAAKTTPSLLTESRTVALLQSKLRVKSEAEPFQWLHCEVLLSQLPPAVACCWPWAAISVGLQCHLPCFSWSELGSDSSDVIPGRGVENGHSECLRKCCFLKVYILGWLLAVSNPRNAFATLSCLARIKLQVSSWTRLILRLCWMNCL